MLSEKLNWRYTTKKMEAGRVVPDEKVERILEAVRLAPTSSGLQPFDVIVVTNRDLREKLKAAAYGQSQITDGSHVLVFAAWDNYTAERLDRLAEGVAAARGGMSPGIKSNFDGLKARLLPRSADANFEHAARQAYIAFGIGLTAAAFEGVDATPMEGFDPAAVDEILGLRARGLRSVTLMPLGYRAAEGDWLAGLPKARRPRAEMITELA